MTFGSATKNFNTGILAQFVKEGKIDEAKQYIQKYVVRIGNPAGCLYWVPSEKKIEWLQDKDVKSLYIKSKMTNGDTNIQKWFFEEALDVYRQCVNVSEGKLFEKDDQKYINHFPGYKHKDAKKYDDFNQELRDGVDFIWKHIETVWCSGKIGQFKYVKQWIINMISGKKQKTSLYLKGVQGIGKSIITEFFTEKVLGTNICVIADDPSMVTGDWNDSLVGKVLLVLEEMPTSNIGELNV